VDRIRCLPEPLSLLQKNDIAVKDKEKTSKATMVVPETSLEKPVKGAGQDQCCEAALVSMRIQIQLFISLRIRIQGAKPNADPNAQQWSRLSSSTSFFYFFLTVYVIFIYSTSFYKVYN
jgi:hypothetical protein